MLKSTREKASHKAIKQELIVAGKVLVAQARTISPAATSRSGCPTIRAASS